MTPLAGDSFAIDTVKVHTFSVNFVAGNDTAEAKIQGLQRTNDGHDAYKRLVEHYEGVGIHSIDIIREADEASHKESVLRRREAAAHVVVGV